jgi:HAD superfamily hydrolase (TIGR01509 family)
MTPAPLPAAVLWDLDGTLVDTEVLWREEEAVLVAERGGTWSLEDGLALVGTALPDYARALQAAGVDLPADEIIGRLSERIIARQAESARWQPGARELVAALTAAGVPQALVTSSYRNLTGPVVRDTAGAFAVVVPGDEVSRPKPDPAPYLLAASRLGVAPEDCVVVEDSRVGVAAGLASGAHVLAVESEVELPDDHRLSLADSLRAVRIDDLARIAAGEVLELRGDRV